MDIDEGRTPLPQSKTEFAKRFGAFDPKTDGTALQYNRRLRQDWQEQFPWRGKFECLADVEAYHERDVVMCLECGHEAENIHSHIHAAHRMTSEEYRAAYNLPWTAPLVGKKLYAEMQAAGQAAVDSGLRNFSVRNMDPRAQENARRGLEANRNKHQAPAYVMRERNRRTRSAKAA